MINILKKCIFMNIVLLFVFLLSSSLFSAPQGFVYREGINFMLDGNRYYFAGTNCYDLFTFGDGSSTHTGEYIETHFMDKARIDAHMDRMKQDGVDVVRLWAFSHESWHGFEPSEGVYFESQFMLFDYILKSAADHGIKLIPVFENYWEAYGGIDSRLQWEGLPYGNHESRAVFFTDPGCKEQYKKYVEFVINRINHYSGVAYKDDPAIFAWELMNEPRYQNAGDDTASINLRAWVDEMGAFIKSLDPNHMLGTGIEGHGLKYNFGGDEGNSFVYIHQSEFVDFCSAHPYPTEHWAGPMSWEQTAALYHAWIDDAYVVGKPLYIGEWNYHTDIVDRVDWWEKTFAIFEASDIVGGSSFWWYSDKPYDPIFGIVEGDAELAAFRAHSNAMIAKRGNEPVKIPPVANFTAEQQSGTLTVHFDASLSADSDGTITGYAWSFGENGVTADYTFSSEGTHEVTLTVTDNDGLTSSMTKTITVSLAQLPPTVNITSPSAGTHIIEGTQISIQADAADQDGTVEKVEFYVDSVLIGTDTSAPFEINWTAADTGTVTIQAIATDNDGLESTPDERTVTIDPAGESSISIEYNLNSWNSGMTAEITITNNSDTDITDWVLTFEFPNDQLITSSWNFDAEQSGKAVTLSTTEPWNNIIRKGETRQIGGFMASHSGVNEVPSAFYLNGTLLDIQ